MFSENCVATLNKLAKIIEQKRFLTFSLSGHSRFGLKSELYKKLIHDLVFQLNQGIGIAVSRPWRKLPVTEQLRLALPHASKTLYEAAAELAKVKGIKNCKKPFCVERGKSVSITLNEAAGAKITRQLVQDLSAHNHPMSKHYTREVRLFEAELIVAAVGMFITAIDTLLNQTGIPRFETLLANVMAKPENYLTLGYPHDVLVHDRLAFENHGSDIEAVYIKDSCCSSHMKLKQNTYEPSESDGYNLTNALIKAKGAVAC